MLTCFIKLIHYRFHSLIKIVTSPIQTMYIFIISAKRPKPHYGKGNNYIFSFKFFTFLSINNL